MTDREIFFHDDRDDHGIDHRRSPFARWFLAMLKTRHMSRTEFATRIGVDLAYINHWALDRLPNPQSCLKIAEGFGIPKADVLIAAGYLDDTHEIDDRNPTRARLHHLIDQLDPELLEPHLVILERTAAILGMSDD
jgi:transcriptional regulator with XRE-family HTH domain